jgi:hypothetical protein
MLFTHYVKKKKITVIKARSIVKWKRP